MAIDYIYESPDGGKTVTRRKFGEREKEIILTEKDVIGEPVLSTLTEEQIETKFYKLKNKLKTVHTRANWTQDYTMARHVKETEELLSKLEHDVRIASESAKLALKNL